MTKERRKERTGRVISNKNLQTVTVVIEWRQRHPIYGKSVRRTTKLYAHDKAAECQIGDIVRIEETRPISHLKRWRVLEIVTRKEIPAVQPSELDSGITSEEPPPNEELISQKSLDSGITSEEPPPNEEPIPQKSEEL